MRPAAWLVYVGVNKDASYNRRRGWVVHAEDGTVLEFIRQRDDKNAKPPGFEPLPTTELIRITESQYYEFLSRTL